MVLSVKEYRDKYGMGVPSFAYEETDLLQYFSKIKNSPVESGSYLFPERQFKKDFSRYIIKENVYYQFVYKFFPSYFEVRTKKYEPMSNVFTDDKRLAKTLDKYYKAFIDNKNFTLHKFMKAVSMASNVYKAGNFSPLVAKHIYNHFTQEGDKVFDFSAGFGGRLLGAIACRHEISYYGVEPNKKTVKGLEDLSTFLGYENSHFFNKGIEDFSTADYKSSFTVCFSSPPYFDLEVYDENDPAQVSNRYKDVDDFVDGFLKAVVEKSLYMLKKDGYFIINLKNFKETKLIEKFLKLMKKYKDFKEDRHYLMIMNNLTFGTENKKKTRTEPIFVFKKSY